MKLSCLSLASKSFWARLSGAKSSFDSVAISPWIITRLARVMDITSKAKMQSRSK